MKPKSTRKRPPKMTPSTTAARLSKLPRFPVRTAACYHSQRAGTSGTVPFRRVLTTLVKQARGARGAIFCDHEGESVELVVRDARLSEYDMKVFGAQLAAAWLDLEADSSECGAGGILELRLWCAEGTLLCRSLREGYYVVLLVAKGAPSGPAAFLLRNAAGEM